MERNDSPGPAQRLKQPLWAWLAIGGGLTLVAILTATAVELGRRPVSTPPGEGAQATPAPAPPSGPVAWEPVPAPQITEAPRPLDAAPPQPARVPMQMPRPQPVAPARPRGRDG